jgi:hypothetical protein
MNPELAAIVSFLFCSNKLYAYAPREVQLRWTPTPAGNADRAESVHLFPVLSRFTAAWNGCYRRDFASHFGLGEGRLSTPMDRTELWIVFAPAPGPMGTGAGSTMHNYSACRNFIKSSGGR